MTSPPGRRSRAAVLGAAAWSILFIALTLTPDADADHLQGRLCILCSERASSDALLNLLVFIPLGALLRGSRVRGRTAVLGCAALSMAVEVAQYFIPGRFPSPTDFGFNVVGGALGFRLPWGALRPGARAPSAPGWLALIATPTILLLTAVLLQPSLPPTTYWGQRSPNLGHLAPFRGTVLDADLGPMPLPSGRLDSSSRARRLLRAGAEIEATVRLGPAPDGLASVVSIYDGRQREIVLLGLEGRHLVLRRRVLAHDLRFDRPDVRWWGALEGANPADTVTLGARSNEGEVCLRAGLRERCGMGWTLSRGWSLLLYLRPPGAWWLPTLDGLWLVVLFAPLGLWGRRLGRAWPLLGIPLSLLVLLPLIAGLVATPVSHFGLAAGAVFAGWGVGELENRRRVGG